MVTRSRPQAAANKPGANKRGRSGASGRGKRAAAAVREQMNKALQQAVEKAATQLHRDRLLRPGAIVFHTMEEAEGATFALRSTDAGVQIESGAGQSEPLLEVFGDPRRIEAILKGDKDARKQFFAGGIRVRGDMHYLSELGMRLGFLKTPIV